MPPEEPCCCDGCGEPCCCEDPCCCDGCGELLANCQRPRVVNSVNAHAQGRLRCTCTAGLATLTAFNYVKLH